MVLEHLNYLAVAVCGIIYFVIGGLWYSPVLFSKTWSAGHKIVMPTNDAEKAEFRKKMPMQMITTFVCCMALTTALACLISAFYLYTPKAGFKIGLLASVFSCVPIIMSHSFTGKSLKIILIDAGYHFIGLIAVGIILSVWK
jgi:hypothetical protein